MTERERMSSAEIWHRALSALEAAARAEDHGAGPAVEDALDGLSPSELMRVCMALCELGCEHLPRYLLPRGMRGARRRRVVAFVERFRLEVGWRFS